MKRSSGTALLMCLLMIAVVLLLGVSGAGIALQGERAARNDRDRKIALQAAEAALLDAQRDIEQAAGTPRGGLFGRAAPRFPAACGMGRASMVLGLCDGLPAGPAWQRVDLADDDAATTRTVAYGQFTGQRMQVGAATLPLRLPRYLIEAYADRRAGAAADLSGSARIYRISALGFGAHDGTRVLLQAWYQRTGLD